MVVQKSTVIPSFVSLVHVQLEVLMLLSQRICQVNRLLKHHRALLCQPQCVKQIGCI